MALDCADYDSEAGSLKVGWGQSPSAPPRKDLERLIPCRKGWKCWFWYSCFRVHYAILMKRGLRRLQPWNRDDLRLLLSLILRAAQACAQPGIVRNRGDLTQRR